MGMAYSCIIADPPWKYSDAMSDMKSTGNGASSQYNTMPFEDICALATYPQGILGGLHLMGCPVADNAHLWLWITNPFLVSGHGQWLIDQWGFTPKTMATWVKGRLVARTRPPSILGGRMRIFTELDPDEDDCIVEPDLVQHFNQGRYLRGTTEHCILAVRGACPALVHDLPNAFVYPGRWAGRLHSEKPPTIHEWAERLSPGPRLELFARRSRAGWDAVGDQLDIDIINAQGDDASPVQAS